MSEGVQLEVEDLKEIIPKSKQNKARASIQEQLLLREDRLDTDSI